MVSVFQPSFFNYVSASVVLILYVVWLLAFFNCISVCVVLQRARYSHSSMIFSSWKTFVPMQGKYPRIKMIKWVEQKDIYTPCLKCLSYPHVKFSHEKKLLKDSNVSMNLSYMSGTFSAFSVSMVFYGQIYQGNHALEIRSGGRRIIGQSRMSFVQSD